MSKAIRLPQLCFHGKPDTEACSACKKDGGHYEKPVVMTAGPYHRAEIIKLTPRDSQWPLDCEARTPAGDKEDHCTGKARYLAAWWVGSSRRRRRLCGHDMREFCKRARIKAPE